MMQITACRQCFQRFAPSSRRVTGFLADATPEPAQLLGLPAHSTPEPAHRGPEERDPKRPARPAPSPQKPGNKPFPDSSDWRRTPFFTTVVHKFAIQLRRFIPQPRRSIPQLHRSIPQPRRTHDEIVFVQLQVKRACPCPSPPAAPNPRPPTINRPSPRPHRRDRPIGPGDKEGN